MGWSGLLTHCTSSLRAVRSAIVGLLLRLVAGASGRDGASPAACFEAARNADVQHHQGGTTTSTYIDRSNLRPRGPIVLFIQIAGGIVLLALAVIVGFVLGKKVSGWCPGCGGPSSPDLRGE